jgi:hypothetical protein
MPKRRALPSSGAWRLSQIINPAGALMSGRCNREAGRVKWRLEMPKKAKASQGPFLPEAFVNRKNINDFLTMIEAGCEYLNSLITDDNVDDPIPQAIYSYRLNVDERLAEIRKTLGDWPVLLNHQHPAHGEMYNAVQRIAEEAQPGEAPVN